MKSSVAQRWSLFFLVLTTSANALNFPPPLPAPSHPPAPLDYTNSPGWRDVPYDVTVLVGAYVTFKCHSFLLHSSTGWLKNGLPVTHGSKKFSFSGDKTVTYGPVGIEDNGIAIGCEVLTIYGRLPSHQGKITVHSVPHYNPPATQLAYIEEPFEFSFNYTAPLPPTFYRWYKNGEVFSGDGGRVTVDHTGIVFTKVEPADAGQYSVKASVKSALVTAVSTLEVVYGDYFQESSGYSHGLSSKLAVLVALNDSLPPPPNGLVQPFSHVSPYAQHVIQLFHKFKKPTTGSRAGGKARVETEQYLLAIAKLTGQRTTDLALSDQDMERIEDRTNCVAAKRRPQCTLRDLQFRSIDGTCNNFFYPLNGASETPFARLLPATYEDGISDPMGLSQLNSGKSFEPPWPSPRLISWHIVKDLQATGQNRLTHMFMQWGQFVDHDLDIAPIFDEDLCGCAVTPKCIPIRIESSDGVFGAGSSNNADCLPFSRSVPACTKKSIPRNQVNDLTSYIDASNVYGSTKKLADSLRLFKGGLLKQGNRQDTLKGNLPFQEETPEFSSLPFFIAGDERSNEQLGLTIMHTVWLREHNRIARQLMKINPCWDDERLYQETRKIVGAIQQVISYKEFLPLVFGNLYMTYVPPYRGYNPFVDASVPNAFAAAAYRFGHSLVRDELERLDRDYKPLSIGALPLEKAFFNPIQYFESKGTDPILRGLTVIKSNPVDEFLNSVLTSKLFVEPEKKLGGDLASLNIQRSRDHGIPSYRTWESYCKKLFPSVDVSFQDPDAAKKFTEIYGEDGYKNGIDLWLGGLAENPLPGGQVGPTIGCVLGITFSRLRDGDRFWYRNPYVFTPAQRLELERISLAKVVCTNGDDIPTIQRNIFKPDQHRVPCSSIPGINLWKWLDRRCYNRRSYQ